MERPDGVLPARERLKRISRERRIPLSGALDLTHRCNLRCVHCYLGDHRDDGWRAPLEMSTGEVCGLLEDAASAGCLDLVISGGEPLLRPDFSTVYRHARELGMVVVVFSNATMILPAHLDVFRRYPPCLVEISLYGATADTYESITGVPGSFQRCLEGIRRLVRSGVRVALKSMILKRNAHEIGDIERLADHLGLPFRLDSVVFSRLDGGGQPLAERVPPDLAARIEFSDERRQRDLRDYYLRADCRSRTDALYECGAASNCFHLDPYGLLSPCVMSPHMSRNALVLGFAEAWRQLTELVAGLSAGSDHPCKSCRLRAVCPYCPGMFVLETGSARNPPPFLCELSKARADYLEITVPAEETIHEPQALRHA